jgi:hypothetical protein
VGLPRRRHDQPVTGFGSWIDAHQLARLALQLPRHSTRPPDVRHVPLPLPFAVRLLAIGTLFEPLVIVACTLRPSGHS